MKNCQIPSDSPKGTICPDCGLPIPIDAVGNYYRACGETSDSVGLGDLAESFFATFGVTKERYVALKAELNLDPNCGCEKRQEALNAFGERFGINDAIGKFSAWLGSRNAAGPL
jgi:hypothetical protein